ncbi:hypothetical protein MJN47_29055, partial [Salmonella enterica subsp. enterica serovar Lubbock]|nr:hypothetical protein [Salmonella enterica subsp. enterica serovar Lubbock]
MFVQSEHDGKIHILSFSKRYARICEMLARRQPDLTVCMEQVHKPHNVSAIIRTADAVGV